MVGREQVLFGDFVRAVEFLELLNAAVVANSFAAASHGVQDLAGAEIRERPLALGRVRIVGGDFELIEGLGPRFRAREASSRVGFSRAHTSGSSPISRIDPAVVRHPKGKPIVERAVPYVRESFFRGEQWGGSTWLTSSERRPASLGHDDGRGRGPCGLQSFASRTPRVRKQSPPWFYSKGRKTLGSPPSKDRNRVRLCDPKLVFTSYGAGCHITTQPTSRPLQAATAPKLHTVSAPRGLLRRCQGRVGGAILKKIRLLERLRRHGCGSLL